MDKLSQEISRTLLAQIRELRRRVLGGDYASNDELDSIEAKLDAISEPSVPEGETTKGRTK